MVSGVGIQGQEESYSAGSALQHTIPSPAVICRLMPRKFYPASQSGTTAFKRTVNWNREEKCAIFHQPYRYNINVELTMEQSTSRTVDTRVQKIHIEKVNVWAGIINSQIIGPYFFDETLTGARYLDFLQNFLVPELRILFPDDDNPNEIDRNIWFQQNGATHFSLEKNFSNASIIVKKQWAPTLNI
ncbi:hypothetical protein NQ318_008815 [Aromia moschata]|uniref:Uncharacterized protein n=1 Tax=Aromia moschata TaxID=1265417 RepID=A0AAV8Z9W1_9CUCU|nr:hypothetical protein NQ318_008815 [Aromia moschata]